MTVVATGCLVLARWAGGLRLVVFAILLAGLVAIEVRYDHNRLDRQHAIGLDAVTLVVQRQSAGTVLFGSTGTSGAFFSSLDYGHPPNLLDRYVSLRARSLDYVDDDSCERALDFVRGAGRRRGVWLFYAAAAGEEAAARQAFARLQGAVADEVHGNFFVVRSRRAMSPRALVQLGRSLRVVWRRAVPLNRRVDELLQADRQLLRTPPSCKPYGDLGDPGISPHWPPITTTHQ